MSEFEKTERKRLDQIADEYRNKGYRVSVMPKAQELPGPLKGFSPDLVAISGSDSVVVECKSRIGLAEDPHVAGLAKAVQELPGWRFELVVTNPDTPGEVERGKSLNEAQILELISQARQLLNAKFSTAAYMSAWIAAEAMLREKATQLEIELPGFAPILILRKLLSEGVLSREQYEKLTAAMRVRDSIVHGFSLSDDPTPLVDDLIKLVGDLQKYQPKYR